jgi:site-specific recombinase XerD
MAIRLGKTKDSRTRKKGSSPINIQALESLKQKLSDQKTFTDYLLQKGLSTSSIERYVRDVRLFIKWADDQNLQVEQISYADLLFFIKQKRSQVQQRTLSCQINSLKHYYHHLTQLYPELEDPTTQLQLKGIKRRSLYYILGA